MHKDEKFWDRLASKFDRIEKNDIAYKIFIDKAGEYLKPDDIILDFGCGTGIICHEIAEKVKWIHAIDISTRMIEIAKEKASRRNIRNIEFERTTLFDEKFKEASLDVIIAFNIFHLLEDPRRYFQRVNKLLKPGGIVLSSTPCMSEAPLLNYLLKFFSLLGITPKLNSFNKHGLEKYFVNSSFKVILLNRIKPNSPQYLCISEKKQGKEKEILNQDLDK